MGDPYDEVTSCNQCVENALCLGGDIIPPEPGYFRYDVNSSLYIECEVEEACEGGFVDEIYYPNGKCKDPYYGHVCS